MNDEAFRVMDLGMQGFQCSQILVQIALEAQGKKNSELVSAMSGLLGGMGCGKTCGALTGACCLIGLYAGMDGDQKSDHERLPLMLALFALALAPLAAGPARAAAWARGSVTGQRDSGR